MLNLILIYSCFWLFHIREFVLFRILKIYGKRSPVFHTRYDVRNPPLADIIFLVIFIPLLACIAAPLTAMYWSLWIALLLWILYILVAVLTVYWYLGGFSGMPKDLRDEPVDAVRVFWNAIPQYTSLRLLVTLGIIAGFLVWVVYLSTFQPVFVRSFFALFYMISVLILSGSLRTYIKLLGFLRNSLREGIRIQGRESVLAAIGVCSRSSELSQYGFSRSDELGYVSGAVFSVLSVPTLLAALFLSPWWLLIPLGLAAVQLYCEVKAVYLKHVGSKTVYSKPVPSLTVQAGYSQRDETFSILRHVWTLRIPLDRWRIEPRGSVIFLLADLRREVWAVDKESGRVLWRVRISGDTPLSVWCKQQKLERVNIGGVKAGYTLEPDPRTGEWIVALTSYDYRGEVREGLWGRVLVSRSPVFIGDFFREYPEDMYAINDVILKAFPRDRGLYEHSIWWLTSHSNIFVFAALKSRPRRPFVYVCTKERVLLRILFPAAPTLLATGESLAVTARPLVRRSSVYLLCAGTYLIRVDTLKPSYVMFRLRQPLVAITVSQNNVYGISCQGLVYEVPASLGSHKEARPVSLTKVPGYRFSIAALLPAILIGTNCGLFIYDIQSNQVLPYAEREATVYQVDETSVLALERSSTNTFLHCFELCD